MLIKVNRYYKFRLIKPLVFLILNLLIYLYLIPYHKQIYTPNFQIYRNDHQSNHRNNQPNEV